MAKGVCLIRLHWKILAYRAGLGAQIVGGVYGLYGIFGKRRWRQSDQLDRLYPHLHDNKLALRFRSL